MIPNIKPYNINNFYHPNFSSQKTPEEYSVAVSYENITVDLLNDLVDEWDEEGLISDGDYIYIMPLKHLQAASNFDRKIAKTLDKAHLSNIGFAITLIDEEGRIHTDALKYYDPRVITILKVVHAIKNNTTLTIPIEDEY